MLLVGALLTATLAGALLVWLLAPGKAKLREGSFCTLDDECQSGCCETPSETQRSLGLGSDGSRRCEPRCKR